MSTPDAKGFALPPVYGYPDLPETWEGAALLIDKPKGWSSFDVIRKLRWLLHIRKIGHAGTLDPMATGLLICLVGRKATRAMEAFMGMPKGYDGTIRLGATTPSYDAETDIDETFSTEDLTPEQIKAATKHFVGTIEQCPPMYSAIKVKGERLYKKARRGEVIERKLRTVTISSFEVHPQSTEEVLFSVACSKGTYIRSLAHDLGVHLGVGGHLTALRRTKIGAFDVSRAWTIAQLEAAIQPKRADQHDP